MEKNANGIAGVVNQLAETFQRLVPLRPVSAKGKPATADELKKASARALAEFYEAARVQREQNRLGIIGRARVAFGLQQRLQSAGYPSQVVKQVLFSLLTEAFVGNPK